MDQTTTVLAVPPMATAESGPRGSAERELDRSLVQGLAWTTAIRWSSQLLTWVSTIVVARLLDPADYGLVGMAGLFIGLVELLSEFGVGASVVMMRDLTRAQLAQLNTLAIGLGILSCLISVAAAGSLGAFFGSEQLPIVVVALSSAFVISAFRVIPYSILQRELRFKLLSLLGGLQAIAAAGSTLAFAYFDFAFWALILGNLVGTAVLTGLVLAWRRCPFAVPRWSSLRPALTFQSNVILARLAWYLYSNADFLVVGRFLGQAALGAYGFGWTLAGIAVEKVSAMFGHVTPAIFSAAQTDKAGLRRYLLGITEVLALVTFPITVGLALVADDLVLLALGEKWIEAVLPLRLLSLYAALRSITPFLVPVLNVTGEAGFVMKCNFAAALFLPGAFYLASRWGTAGVAATWLIGYPLVALPLYWRTFRRIDLRTATYLRSLWPAASSTLLMVAVVLPMHWWIPAPPSLPVRLGLQVAAGAAAYGLAVFQLHGARVVAFRRMLALARSG